MGKDNPKTKESFKKNSNKFKRNTKISNSAVKTRIDKKDKKESVKKFNKKEWRLKKYSKKYKIQKWVENRNKSIIKKFYKETKDDNHPCWNISELPGGSSDKLVKTNLENTKQRKISAFKAAKLEYQRLQDVKKAKKEEALKRKLEKDEALNEYKRKKLEKLKKLNKKNKKGQPIMKGRLEMLLEKIQASVSNN